MEESCNSPFILLTKKKHLKAAIHWACVQFPRPELTSYSPDYTCCEWLICKIDTISTNFINLWLCPWRSCLLQVTSKDTSFGVTINHFYQYCSGKERGTKESNEERQKERKKEKKNKSHHPDEGKGHQSSRPAKVTLSWKPDIWTEWRPLTLPNYIFLMITS